MALFARDWMAPIYEEDVPAPAELGGTVRLALTPGEYEPASVGLRLRDGLRGLRLVPSALTGPGGATIPAAAFDVRVVRMIEPRERWPKLKEHPRHPGFLDPQEAAGADLAAATTRAYWITLRAPDDAAAGSYRGSLAVVADGAELAALPLEVEVYPFRLGEARPALWVYGDNWPLSAASLRRQPRARDEHDLRQPGLAEAIGPAPRGHELRLRRRLRADDHRRGNGAAGRAGPLAPGRHHALPVHGPLDRRRR